ncbi:MAG TPA: hypothetical protein VK252_06740 [Solirubrobacteraceae bacterium]|nr:hypothetical protein [Solirubrobacteraceae bacterium]
MSGVAAGIDGGPADGATAGADAQALARIVFALLVVACFAAFFVTQRLKHTPTVVQRFERTPTFTPAGPAPGNLEEISFKLANADEATVAIIDSSGDVVATLVRDRPLARYKQFSLRWNGRRGTAHRYGQLETASGRAVLVAENEGPLAPPGEYRVRVSLRRQNRTVLSPWSFTLVGR